MIVTVMELTHIVTKKCVSVSQNRKNNCFLNNIRPKESQGKHLILRSYCSFLQKSCQIFIYPEILTGNLGKLGFQFILD